MRNKILLLFAILMIITVSSILANPVIFSHPYDPNSQAAVVSAQGNSVDVFQSYTDYYYDNSYIMTDFHWWGMGSAPQSFEITIYENNDSNTPGLQVYSQLAAYGDVNAVIDGAFGDNDVYKYSVDFTTPPSDGLASGLYWFSVKAIYDTNRSWFWNLGEFDLWNEDLQWNYSAGEYSGNPGELFSDFAFEITGIPAVPEPATLTLFGLGLLGSAVARRRRNINN